MRTLAWNETIATPTISSGPLSNLVAPFSIALWVWQNTNPFGQSLVQNWMALGSGKASLNWTTDLAPNPFFRFQVRDSGGGFTNIPSAWNNLNAWAHVCGTYDLTTMRLYVNGSQVLTGAHSDASWATTSDTVVFGNTGGSSQFDGALDEPGIWNVTLTPDEVAALAQGVRPHLIRPSALAFWMPFLAHETRVLGDIAEPELTGTATAAPIPNNLPRNEGGPSSPYIPWTPAGFLGIPPT